MCSSIGLEPISQPPGKGILASPNLLNRAPIQKKLALSPFTSSYGSSFMEIFFLRSGYKFNKNEENLTLGAGLFIPLGRFKLRVDYGYVNFDHLTDPNRFSIGISL